MTINKITLATVSATFTSAAGNYTINSIGGNDTITTGAGDSTVNVLAGNNTISMGAGNNSINAMNGNNTITTGAGASNINVLDGNNTITTGAGNSNISAGNGNNTITTGAGDSHVTALVGNNTITTGAGDSIIHTMGGNNTITAGAGTNTITTGNGNDTITGGAGSDVIDSGGGSDTVSAAAGNDSLIYVAAENANPSFHSTYDGGTGVDTLRLVLTRAEWMSSAVQSDVAKYLSFLSAHTGVSGEADASPFTFSAFGLTTKGIEKLAVTVDGVAIDPANHPVTLVDAAITTSEKIASLPVDVLIHDSVPDLIQNISYTNPVHGSVAFNADYSHTASAPTAAFIYTPAAGFYDYLAVGEHANDSFTYTVTDATGDVSTATVNVTITGTNDVPMVDIANVTGAVSTTPGKVLLSSSATIGFSDVDLSDTHSVSQVQASEGALGTLTANVSTDTTHGSSGVVTWHYSVADTAVEYLTVGQTKVETFSFNVLDNNGGSVARTVTETITGTNHAPVLNTPATLDHVKVNATSTISMSTLLQGWSDADQDTLSVTNLGVNHGTVVNNNNGTITISPTANYTGPEVLSYGVSDGHITIPTNLTFTVDPAPVVGGNVLVTEFPWGQKGDVTAMNDVFGVGNYSLLTNYNMTASSIFNTATSFIFLEGGANTDTALNNFVNANSAAILQWVDNGGKLFVESAGWDTSITGLTNTIVLEPRGYPTANSSGHLTDEGLAAFTHFANGATTFTGGYLAHDIVTGSGLTNFMVGNNNGGVILAGVAHGSGYIMYSGLTDINFNNAHGVLDNAIAYTSAH